MASVGSKSNKSTLHVYKNGVEVNTVDRVVKLNRYRSQSPVWLVRYEKMWRVCKLIPDGTLHHFKLELK